MGNRSVKEQAILDNIIACMEYKKLTQKDLCEYLRVEKNPAAEEATGFDFGESECTIERISEPFIVWGTVFVQTRRHSLP